MFYFKGSLNVKNVHGIHNKMCFNTLSVLVANTYSSDAQHNMALGKHNVLTLIIAPPVVNLWYCKCLTVLKYHGGYGYKFRFFFSLGLCYNPNIGLEIKKNTIRLRHIQNSLL